MKNSSASLCCSIPQCPRHTTCAEEYLQLLSLDVLNTNSLFPKQIEMVDLWLDSLGGDFEAGAGL